MKTGIHPTYYDEARVICGCGHSYVTGGTKAE
ncbi:MAG: 50S ribosomal protein L31, partial [Dehalococcoidia bacterium]|nr:50S ribosomal protein L31 [Dehalococcoidia bacterium]